jgi:Holliday junction DNA helicase RuvA
MLGYLTGKIENINVDHIYLDVNGVGYKVFFPIGQKDNFKKAKEAKLYIYENIREDRYDLYGFLKIEELGLFEKLISVNGVGPKAGMTIMSVDNYQNIINAISGENISFFTAISGIGKKVASKIILDLKSKLSGVDVSDIVSMSKDAEDIVDAMEALGYKKSDIGKIIGKIPQELKSTQEKIRWMLKNI